MERKWGILTHLSFNIAGDLKRQEKLIFDEAVWNRVVDKCEEHGLNTIVLDVNDGVQWESHPEISLPGAWSKEKVRSEVLRLREKGIQIIPKLNFSTTHDVWMGEYGRMVSTSVYYKVCVLYFDHRCGCLGRIVLSAYVFNGKREAAALGNLDDRC